MPVELNFQFFVEKMASVWSHPMEKHFLMLEPSPPVMDFGAENLALNDVEMYAELYVVKYLENWRMAKLGICHHLGMGIFPVVLEIGRKEVWQNISLDVIHLPKDDPVLTPFLEILVSLVMTPLDLLYLIVYTVSAVKSLRMRTSLKRRLLAKNYFEEVVGNCFLC